MREYKQVPVIEAGKLASKYDKDVVIILSIDKENARLHVTTVGRSVEDKHYAAELGEKLHKILCHLGEAAPGPIETYADFRRGDPACPVAARNDDAKT